MSTRQELFEEVAEYFEVQQHGESADGRLEEFNGRKERLASLIGRIGTGVYSCDEGDTVASIYTAREGYVLLPRQELRPTSKYYGIGDPDLESPHGKKLSWAIHFRPEIGDKQPTFMQDRISNMLGLYSSNLYTVTYTFLRREEETLALCEKYMNQVFVPGAEVVEHKVVQPPFRAVYLNPQQELR